MNIEGGVEQGALFQHGAGDAEQAVGDRSEGAAMTVPSAAQRGVLGSAWRSRSRQTGSIREGYADLGCRPQAALRSATLHCARLAEPSMNRWRKVQGSFGKTAV